MCVKLLPYVGSSDSNRAALEGPVFMHYTFAITFAWSAEHAALPPFYLAAAACLRLGDCASERTLERRLRHIFEHSNATLVAYSEYNLCAAIASLRVTIRRHTDATAVDHSFELCVNVPNEQILHKGWTMYDDNNIASSSPPPPPEQEQEHDQ